MNDLAYGATDVGRKGDNNEDCYSLLPERDIYVVADGMGGHNAGDVASLNAVKIVGEYFTAGRISDMKGEREKIKENMINAVIEAHKEIARMSQTKAEYFDMGCTIALAFIHDHVLHTCHVGDSRVYILDQSGITQITNDHSHVWELVRAGQMSREEARHSPLKNQVTQAIGAHFPVAPEYNEHPLNKHDKILICSDGLWDMLSDEEIHAIVITGSTPEATCKKLIEKANKAGGDDNITVVILVHKE